MVACSKALAPYINSEFLVNNCIVIDEVVYESRNSKRAESIKKMQRPIKVEDLEHLKSITDDCVNKYKILELYAGCADALLLATALAIMQPSEGQRSFFDPNSPVIVTEERALRDACDDLTIRWLSQKDFVNLVKATQLQEMPLGV